ncbi:MAG: hypothetical protein GXO21_05415 [Aquificae bacterium]|nr:hypothetical protein [Aquificota bacterium]
MAWKKINSFLDVLDLEGKLVLKAETDKIKRRDGIVIIKEKDGWIIEDWVDLIGWCDWKCEKRCKCDNEDDVKDILNMFFLQHEKWNIYRG